MGRQKSNYLLQVWDKKGPCGYGGLKRQHQTELGRDRKRKMVRLDEGKRERSQVTN